MKAVTLALFLASATCVVTAAADLVLVEEGESRLPVVVAEGAGPETVQAANELADYLAKTSGARPEVLVEERSPAPAHAIWVGLQPGVEARFPGVKLEFSEPEEILIVCGRNDLLIAGRDRVVEGKQIEYGTVNAVYTFLQKHLGVRWLWPGPLGEDVLPRQTVALPCFSYRFHPPFRVRHLWPGQPKEWYRRMRLQPLYSLPFSAGHAFGDWWGKYHEAHPDWFALLPDGTRKAPSNPAYAKLCVSNPEVQAQWIADAERALRADPTRSMVSASPNDGGGACLCDRCRAWDHPDGSPVTLYGKPYVALTDRYVKFWNILAGGLRGRLPDREFCVGAHAYGAYMTPPVAAKLDKSIAISYVGFFPLTSEDSRRQQKHDWQRWSEMASLLVYRPNMWYWAGGVWGLPEVAMRKTIEDFAFLAEHKCVGLQVDTVRGHWATQGPQYYVMAALAYDPRQDGAVLLQDYYRRAFGPAAADVEHYWNLMEGARDAVVAAPDFKLGSRHRFGLPAIFQRVYTDDFFRRADDLMRQAERRAAEDSDRYRRRVAFVRAGLDFTRRMIANIPLMDRVRATRGKDTEAVAQTIENWVAMEEISRQAGPFAIGCQAVRNVVEGKVYMGGMQDYFGPPAEKFRTAAGLP